METLANDTPPSFVTTGTPEKTITREEILPTFTVQAGHTPHGTKFVQIRNSRTGEALLSVANERALALAQAIMHAYAHNAEQMPAVAIETEGAGAFDFDSFFKRETTAASR